MSVSVTIRTKNIPDPNLFLKHLVESGEQIVVTSNEYPCVRFGTNQKAIRGIEVNEEENGIEVRVCMFASAADYLLFAKTIAILMKLTASKAFLEDDDEEEITDPLSVFNNDWIEAEIASGINITRALINHEGNHIVMYGLFCKFCVGAKLYSRYGIPLTDEYEKENADSLMEHLCDMQWLCADLEDTSNSMELRFSNSDSDRGLTVSIISIKGGKVKKFDYLSEADVLVMMDMDDESMAPVLIPFKEAWKVLPSDLFRPLDELQYKLEGELTVDMVREMMAYACYLQPDDLQYKPTYPGNGFDENQNTFILMWNPDISSVSLEAHRRSIKHMLTEYFNWSVWDYEKAKCGDRFFLVKVDDGNTGIVMSGVFDSHPYEAEDWSGKGRRVFYMDMIPNVILDPDHSPIVSTEELQKAIPSFDWTGGHSGRILSADEAQTLEAIWQNFLAEHKDDVDGSTMNVVWG